MNDYIGIIGLACLNEEFRTSLFANGAGVAETTLHLTAPDLTTKERAWLDYLRDSTGAERDSAWGAFASVETIVGTVCPQPPCGRYALDGSRLPGNP